MCREEKSEEEAVLVVASLQIKTVSLCQFTNTDKPNVPPGSSSSSMSFQNPVRFSVLPILLLTLAPDPTEARHRWRRHVPTLSPPSPSHSAQVPAERLRFSVRSRWEGFQKNMSVHISSSAAVLISFFPGTK